MWKHNKVFWLGYAFFIAGSLMILLFIDKGDEILYINKQRTPVADLFFIYTTRLGEAYILIPALLLLLFYQFRYAFTVPLLGLTILFASAIPKQLFAHPRPYLYFKENRLLDQIQLVEGVTMNGGRTSFPSGHTMTAFAVFAFLAFCLPNKRGTAVALLLVAILVGISRIYLVMHFLEDVVFGSLIGVALAVLWYKVQFQLFKPHNRLFDKKLTINNKKQAGA